MPNSLDRFPTVEEKRKDSSFLSGIIAALVVSVLTSAGAWFFSSKIQIELIEQKIRYQNEKIQELNENVKDLSEKITVLKESTIQAKYLNDSSWNQITQEIQFLNERVKRLEHKKQ